MKLVQYNECLVSIVDTDGAVYRWVNERKCISNEVMSFLH